MGATSHRAKSDANTQADPNLYIRGDGILILLYVDDISMTYPEAPTKAVIEVKAKLSEKYKITILGPARQFLGVGIHRDDIGIGISLGPKAFINTIFKRFGMDYAHNAMTPMDPNVNLDLAEDWREKELEEIKEYQEIVGSLMYTALETRPGISFALASLCRYNSLPFTSHMTAARECSDISNLCLTIVYTAAQNPTTVSLDTRTPIGLMIVQTGNLKEDPFSL